VSIYEKKHYDEVLGQILPADRKVPSLWVNVFRGVMNRAEDGETHLVSVYDRGIKTVSLERFDNPKKLDDMVIAHTPYDCKFYIYNEGEKIAKEISRDAASEQIKLANQKLLDNVKKGQTFIFASRHGNDPAVIYFAMEDKGNKFYRYVQNIGENDELVNTTIFNYTKTVDREGFLKRMQSVYRNDFYLMDNAVTAPQISGDLLDKLERSVNLFEKTGQTSMVTKDDYKVEEKRGKEKKTPTMELGTATIQPARKDNTL
jgi:hypothetical protein